MDGPYAEPATSVVIPCRCVWGGPFLEMSRGTAFVFLVKVVEYGPAIPVGPDVFAWMEADVLDVIKGGPVSGRVRIFGNRGAACMPFISPTSFEVGGEYAMALWRADPAGPRAYGVSLCGEYWVAHKGGVLSGKISSDRPQQLEYEAVKRLIDGCTQTPGGGR